MAIDYQKIYKKALANKENGIFITDTVESFLGHRDTANFYKALTQEQKNKLKNARYLSDKQKKEFKRLYLEEGYTMTQLRAKYKIRGETAVKYINSVSNEYARSFKNPNRKLTKYQVVKILIERMKYGTLQRELAKKYNVSESRISCICTGRDWKHVFQHVKKKYNNEILSLKTNEKLMDKQRKEKLIEVSQKLIKELEDRKFSTWKSLTLCNIYKEINIKNRLNNKPQLKVDYPEIYYGIFNYTHEHFWDGTACDRRDFQTREEFLKEFIFKLKK